MSKILNPKVQEIQEIKKQKRKMKLKMINIIIKKKMKNIK